MLRDILASSNQTRIALRRGPLVARKVGSRRKCHCGFRIGVQQTSITASLTWRRTARLENRPHLHPPHNEKRQPGRKRAVLWWIFHQLLRAIWLPDDEGTLKGCDPRFAAAAPHPSTDPVAMGIAAHGFYNQPRLLVLRLVTNCPLAEVIVTMVRNGGAWADP